jgi:hypothetical protein
MKDQEIIEAVVDVLTASGGDTTAALKLILRRARDQAFEEAAKAAELRMRVFGGEPTTDNERLIVEHIVAAIRALKQ